MAVLMPFALREVDQRYVDADAVPSGIKCGCTCPKCREGVIARHCTEKTSHFAHKSGTACAGAAETVLHETAKQIILELGFVWLPESEAAPVTKFVFAQAEAEKSTDRLRPDVLISTASGRRLAVEIVVTHDVSWEKMERYGELGLSCVAYDLSAVERDLTYDKLKGMFAGNQVYSRWVHNAKAVRIARVRRAAEEARSVWRERVLKEWALVQKASARELPITVRVVRGDLRLLHVDGCPQKLRWFQGRSYAIATRDCAQCRYCVGERPTYRRHLESVRCLGHLVPRKAEARDRWLDRLGESGLLKAIQNPT